MDKTHPIIKISFHTIGCRVNQYETAVLRNIFANGDFAIVPEKAIADIAVINTCTVTANSDTDTRRLINRLIRINPSVRIALIGCQAQLHADTLKTLPNVRWIVGNACKFDLREIIQAMGDDSAPHVVTPTIKKQSFCQPVPAIDDTHTRANLKIQDGCINFCTYCDIPYARGPARSRVFRDLINEAHALANAGHKEIVLTGINIGAYQFQGYNLLDVIKALEDIHALRRIRISSIEPSPVVVPLIQHMNQPSTKLCRFLHLPIQYAHDDILQKMHRRYSLKEVIDIIIMANDTVPRICIGSDIITGFPGETPLIFDDAYAALKQMPLHYFHVFSFSPRHHAPAKDFPDQIPAKIIAQRSQRLRLLSQRKRRQFYQHMLGQTATILFEQKKGNAWQGTTDNFIPVKVCSNKPLKNQMRRVQLISIHGSQINGILKISRRS